MSRGIPANVHAAVEIVAAPAIMAAPFVLGFGQAAALLTLGLGAALLGHALQVVQVGGPRRSMSLSAHAGLDYVLGTVAVASGLFLALGAGQWGPGSFLVGIGAAQFVLTSSTRFSMPVRI